MNDELLSDVKGQPDNPFGYSTFFEHFNFSKDDKINNQKVEMLSDIYNFFLRVSSVAETSPLYELSIAERTVNKSTGVSLLEIMAQYVRINKSIEASFAELQTL